MKDYKEEFFIRKDLTEKEFRIFINSEILSRRVYDFMIKNKSTKEYVDIILTTFSSLDLNDFEVIETLYQAKDILLNSYGVDMVSLPFKYENIKKDLEDYISNIDIKI